MSVSSRPKRFASLVMHVIDAVVSRVGRAGIGAFGWPLAIGVGLGTGLFGLARRDFVASVVARRATMDWMFPALRAVVVAFVTVTASASIIAWIRRRRTRAPVLVTYRRFLKAIAVLSTLPLVVALHVSLVPGREWLALAFILTTAIVAAYSVYESWPEPRLATGAIGRVTALVLLTFAAAVFVLRISAVGIDNHSSFNTGRADLGFYVSRFREASEGRPFACSLCASGRFKYEHFEPIVALLSPAYAAHPWAQTLIVVQALLLASGAFAVFFLAQDALCNLPAFALGIAYLAYPPLQEIALFDFHAVAAAVPLCLFLLLALRTHRPRAYFALAVLLLLVREDMGFVLAAVGVYAIGQGRSKLGWATVVLAVVGLVVVQFVSPAGVLHPLNEVVGELTTRRRGSHVPVSADLSLAVVQRVFSEGKALQTAQLFVPLLGLPLLARGRILWSYGALIALLAPSALPESSNADEGALLIPFVFAFAAQVLVQMFSGRLTYGAASGPRLGRALSVGILLCSLLACYELGPLRDAPFKAGPRLLARNPSQAQIALDRDLHKLSVSWPKGVKVAASSNLLPHLGGASRLYALDDRAGTDYVVAFMKQRQVARRIEAEETAGQLVRVGTYGDVRVYRTRYRAQLPRHTRQLEDE
ncbi:MAG TPA: DUF2079 domain-containing protein [Polyangiaceae bacterium]|nr:DUF2079 domain-containing protein [Polyangiaceae bacterium]